MSSDIKYTVVDGDLPLGIELEEEGLLTGMIYLENLAEAPSWVTPGGVIGTFDEGETFTFPPLEATALPGKTISTYSTIPIRYNTLMKGLPWGLQLNATTGVISGKLLNPIDNSISPGIEEEWPVWNSAGGDLGAYDEGDSFTTTLSVTGFESAPVDLSVVKGFIPWGLRLNPATKVLSGSFAPIKDPNDPVVSKPNPPTWATVEGEVGWYADQQSMSLTFSAVPTAGRTITSYSVIGGELPWGLRLNNNGVLDGAPIRVNTTEAVTAVAGTPEWQTAHGSLGVINERSSFSYQVQATRNPVASSLVYDIVKGYLPWGLRLTRTNGSIAGVAADLKNPETPLENYQRPVWVTSEGLLQTVDQDAVLNIQLSVNGYGGKTIASYESVTKLPVGVTLSATGKIEGIVTGANLPDTEFVQPNNPPEWITESDLGTVDEGTSSTFTFQATPMSGTVTYDTVKGGLPWGLRLVRTTGAVVGSISHNVGSSTDELVEVFPKPVWVTDVDLGDLYDQQTRTENLQATGSGTMRYDVIGILPVGFTLTNTGSLVMQVTQTTREYTPWSGLTPPTVLAATLLSGTSSSSLVDSHLGTYGTGATIIVQLNATPASGQALSNAYLVSGYLPKGLTISVANRRITGTVSTMNQSGSYSFTIRYTDNRGSWLNVQHEIVIA